MLPGSIWALPGKYFRPLCFEHLLTHPDMFCIALGQSLGFSTCKDAPDVPTSSLAGPMPQLKAALLSPLSSTFRDLLYCCMGLLSSGFAPPPSPSEDPCVPSLHPTWPNSLKARTVQHAWVQEHDCGEYWFNLHHHWLVSIYVQVAEVPVAYLQFSVCWIQAALQMDSLTLQLRKTALCQISTLSEWIWGSKCICVELERSQYQVIVMQHIHMLSIVLVLAAGNELQFGPCIMSQPAQVWIG